MTGRSRKQWFDYYHGELIDNGLRPCAAAFDAWRRGDMVGAAVRLAEDLTGECPSPEQIALVFGVEERVLRVFLYAENRRAEIAIPGEIAVPLLHDILHGIDLCRNF